MPANFAELAQQSFVPCANSNISAILYSMGPEDRFFSRRNIVAAAWAALIGVAGYFLGQFVSSFQPTAKVVVANANDFRPSMAPTIVYATATLDEESRAEIRAASRAVISLANQQQRELGARQSISEVEVAALKSQIELLTKTTDSVKKSSTTLTAPTPPSSILITTPPATAINFELVRPTESASFELPATAKGYWPAKKPRTLAGLSCPRTKVIEPLSTLILAFRVRTKLAIDKMSPMYLSVIETQQDNSYIQRFASYLPILVGDNLVEIRMRSRPGRFELVAGYYELANLGGDYPVLFSINCPFTISAR